jgi:hypothetical protein
MIPPLLSAQASYYRLLFVFLINKIIDMCFNPQYNSSTFWVVWELLNRWFGIVACAIAFCSIAPDFVEIFEQYLSQFNMLIFIAALSCTLKGMALFFYNSLLEERIRKKISRDLNWKRKEMIL